MDAKDVRPSDLFTALAELCEQFRAAGDIECRAMISATHMRFPPELAAVLYQAMRELLANVRQHARATRVQVTSSAGLDGTIRLGVTDNGVGFTRHWREASPFAASSGIGLWSIDQRLRGFGAYLDVESSTNGTRATLVIPAPALIPQ